MPIYEFECNVCGSISEEFYPVIPKVVPTRVAKVCGDCANDTSHRKIISEKQAFHLKPGRVSWGEDRYSSASAKGTDVVDFNEPD
jgi:hypothetical protein